MLQTMTKTKSFAEQKTYRKHETDTKQAFEVQQPTYSRLITKEMVLRMFRDER